MSLYRGNRIPSMEFLQKIKKVDVNLYPCFDDLSLRWDILYKNPYSKTVENVLRVCVRDNDYRDVGYLPLDDRVIVKLLKMDLARRNIAPKTYTDTVKAAEKAHERNLEKKTSDDIDYVFKHERHTIDRARDALRGVYRRF